MVATDTSCDGSPWSSRYQRVINGVLCGQLTNLVFRQDPAECSDPRGRAYNAMQGDLTDLDQIHRSIGNTHYIVIENVLVGIDK